MAAGEDIAREIRDVLADVRSVIERGETGAQWEDIKRSGKALKGAKTDDIDAAIGRRKAA